MTPSTPKAGENTVISVTKWFDNKKVEAFLADIFSAWERGRKADSSGKVPSDDWGYIVRRTMEYSASVAAATLEDAGGPIAASGAQHYSKAAFADGLAKGQAMVASKPAGKLFMPAAASPQMDSEAILKTIGGEMRKMFEAGLEQGKSTTDAVIEAGKLAKPSGEIVKVQRNGAGEIIGAVKQLVYDGNGGA